MQHGRRYHHHPNSLNSKAAAPMPWLLTTAGWTFAQARRSFPGATAVCGVMSVGKPADLNPPDAYVLGAGRGARAWVPQGRDFALCRSTSACRPLGGGAVPGDRVVCLHGALPLEQFPDIAIINRPG